MKEGKPPVLGTPAATTRKKVLGMTFAPKSVYTSDPPETLADVRSAMSRRNDFDPAPEHYADQARTFEVLAALEALAVEGEVLA